MRRHRDLILLALAAFGLGLYLWSLNPRWTVFNHVEAPGLNERPPMSPPAVLRPAAPSECDAVSVFRSDEARSGADGKSLVRADASVLRKFRPVNAGIHLASKSSPAVDDTGIYVASDTGWLIKVSHTGNVMWRFYAAPSDNGFHGTPALTENLLLIGDYNGALSALDKMTGKMIWSNFAGDFIGASPLVRKGFVYISTETMHPNGFLAKMNCLDGTYQWVSEWFGGHSHSSPAYDAVTGLLFVGSNSDWLFAIDDRTGKTVWKYKTDGPVKATPMVHGDMVLVASWDEHLYAFSTRTGELIWKQLFLKAHNLMAAPTLVLDPASAIINTSLGETVSVDLRTGRALWVFKNQRSNNKHSALATKDPATHRWLVWTACFENDLCTLDARDGRLLHRRAIGGAFNNMPVAYGNKLYISLEQDGGLVVLQ